jgi:transmembrane sensor
MSIQTAKEVDEEAAAWALRVDSGALDAAPSPELQAWLDGDVRRTGAFLRAQAALSFLDRGRALEQDACEPRPGSALSAGRLTRRAVLGAGAGGALAAGLGAAAILGAEGRRYATELGEISRVPLRDGSIMDINTSSVLNVAMHARGRNVVLHRGEAWFEVAKDPGRPFLVRAGDARFRAVGTAFSVRRMSEGAELLVTEGRVEAWLSGAAGRRVMIDAGCKILLDGRQPLRAAAAPQQIERSLAWRNGQISLDGETLAEAADEFNRYNRRKLVIEDPVLARRQFVGLFRTDDPQSFAVAVSATSGAHLVEDADAIRLR